MSISATTGNPVRKLVAVLFTPVKFPPLMSPRRSPDAPETLGEDVKVRMSQKTLIFLLAAVASGTLAWTNLKAEASKNHDALLELTALRANDALDRKADHDLLMKVANGVDRLERRADREDRRNSITNH